MFLYRLWQRLPNRDEWLRARWPDVKAAGDWVLWQFDHPEISGASNDVLFTTSEAAAMVGYSVYPDYTCMNALRALAEMADSIGETNSADQWRARADKMQSDRQTICDYRSEIRPRLDVEVRRLARSKHGARPFGSFWLTMKDLLPRTTTRYGVHQRSRLPTVD